MEQETQGVWDPCLWHNYDTIKIFFDTVIFFIKILLCKVLVIGALIQYKNAILWPSYLHNGIYNMAVLVRWYLYIESGPCSILCLLLSCSIWYDINYHIIYHIIPYHISHIISYYSIITINHGFRILTAVLTFICKISTKYISPNAIAKIEETW